MALSLGYLLNALKYADTSVFDFFLYPVRQNGDHSIDDRVSQLSQQA